MMRPPPTAERLLQLLCRTWLKWLRVVVLQRLPLTAGQLLQLLRRERRLLLKCSLWLHIGLAGRSITI